VVGKLLLFETSPLGSRLFLSPRMFPAFFFRSRLVRLGRGKLSFPLIQLVQLADPFSAFKREGSDYDSTVCPLPIRSLPDCLVNVPLPPPRRSPLSPNSQLARPGRLSRIAFLEETFQIIRRSVMASWIFPDPSILFLSSIEDAVFQ